MLILGDQGSSEPINVDTDDVYHFDPVEFDWGDKLLIYLHPFKWNYCSVWFNGETVNWEPLINWYQSWFSGRTSTISNFANCIHVISDPEQSQNGWQIYIDLGSAEIVVFENMLDASSLTGTNKLVVGEPPRRAN